MDLSSNLLFIIIFKLSLFSFYCKEFEGVRRITYDENYPCIDSFENPKELYICNNENFQKEWNSHIAFLKFKMKNGFIAQGYIRKVHDAHLYFVKEAKIYNSNGDLISHLADSSALLKFYKKSTIYQLKKYLQKEPNIIMIANPPVGEPYLFRAKVN